MNIEDLPWEMVQNLHEFRTCLSFAIPPVIPLLSQCDVTIHAPSVDVFVHSKDLYEVREAPPDGAVWGPVAAAW